MEIKIGYIPTRRDVFSREEALRYRTLVKDKIRPWGAQLIDIDDINSEGLLFDEVDVPSIVCKMEANHVDGLFFPHCNFGTEDLVAKIAKQIKKPVLLWGPRDDMPLENGMRTRDTQCGLFATGKVLRRFNVTFTYLENSWLDAPVFEEGYRRFIGVCAVIKTFSHLRILQLGPRPDPFWSVICNEGELIEKFGIQITPISLIDLVKKTEQIMDESSDEYVAEVEAIQRRVHVAKEDQADMRKISALKLAIRALADQHNCNCAAIQCWHALQKDLAVMPCIVNGLLAEEFFPVTCETDLCGAVTSLLLQSAAMNSSPVFFADLTTRHPTNDNAELLWHCGNFPPSLADESCTLALGHNFVFPEHCCGTGEWKIKGGDVTICRFDGDHGEYRLFVGEGHGIEGPRTRGTYLWIEVDDWRKWEKTLVEGPYIHHCAGIHGKFADVLEEACRYIPGISVDRMG